MAARRSNSSTAVAELATLMLFSPMVITARLTQFWLSAAAPTAKDRAEASLMITEKMQAAGESLLAMNVATMTAVADTAAAAMAGRQGADATDAILTAALKPYTRRVKANRRRLSK